MFFAALLAVFIAQVTPAPSPLPSALSVSPAVVRLHPAQSQSLTIAGGSAPYTASVDNPVVSVTIDQVARIATLTAAQQPGSATVTVSDSTGASVRISVLVGLDAGSVPAAFTLRVTGDPLDPQWLQTQLQKMLLRGVQAQPGAAVRIDPFTLPPQLATGAIASVPVHVHVSGNGYFDVDALTNVDLENVAANPFTASLLFYDDDPEKLIANGVLYRGQVSAADATRLYYYHENTAEQRRLAVVLSTSSAQPVTVQLIDASAGPNADVMTVGHAVSRDALAQEPSNEGVVVDVAPDAPYVADEFLMDPLEGAAGSIGIHLLGGGPVEVTILAVAPSVTDAQIAQYLALPQLPDDGHHRTGVFSLATYGTSIVAYTVDGPDASFRYGSQTPPPAGSASGHDYGDYGVLRTVTFDADNPTAQPQTVYLYERPIGGVVRSSFLVNGTLVQVGCARVSQRYQIGTPIALPPGAAEQVVVQTMTDGGSNYPLEIGMTQAPPLASVPPISAPDGCFPKRS